PKRLSSDLGQIDDGWLVRARLVIDAQFIAVGQGVGHRQLQRSRVSFGAVGAGMSKTDRRAGVGRQRFTFPVLLVQPFWPAVNVVASVIGGELVSLPVKSELRARDAIGIPAGGIAEERMALQVRFE